MNEEDIARKKIEKREKFDVFLAYILLIIILASIGMVLYLKFIKNNNQINEKESNYLTLEQIVTLLNGSELANKYNQNNETFTTSIEDKTIKISYVKDNENTDLNIKLINNELEVDLSKNEEFATLIYKELGKIICTYYGNEENTCKTTIDSLNSENAVDGIRFVNTDNKNIVYLNITRSIDTSTQATNNNTYTKETIAELAKNDYVLSIENTTISNISVSNDTKNITVNGHISSETKNDVLKIVVKLYDENDKILEEKTKEYNSESPLVNEDDFSVSFELNDNLKLENIKKYSINVVR